jgi:hypothetical protein
MARLDGSGDLPGGAVKERLSVATPDEMFDFIDREFGRSPH